MTMRCGACGSQVVVSLNTVTDNDGTTLVYPDRDGMASISLFGSRHVGPIEAVR